MPANCSAAGSRGRPSKGDRQFIATRVRADVDSSIRSIADNTKTPFGDVVGTMLLIGTRHIDQFDDVFRELLPLTRTTVDGQVQFDPSAHDAITSITGRAPTPVESRAREIRSALSPHGKIPMMLVFSTLLTIGVRNCEGDAFTSALADMYELALDPKLARKMLSESSIPRRLEEQGVLALAI